MQFLRSRKIKRLEAKSIDLMAAALLGDEAAAKKSVQARYKAHLLKRKAG